MKVPAFFFALFLGNLQLSAQCLTLSNCPATAQTVCDYSINSAELWNEPFWYDPIFGSHDLAEAPTDLSMQVTSNCGLENVQVSFVLLLDLNGDGVRETAISSKALQNCSKLMLGFQDAVVYPGFRFYPLSFVFPTGNPLALPIPNYVLLDSATLSQPIVFVGVKTCDISCMPISGTDDLAANSANIGLAQPNPTAAGLVIPLTLLQSAMVEIELLDLTGRLLYRTSVCLGAGDQQLEVPATAFPQAGLYCWRVQVGAELRSGKVFKQ